MIDIFFNQEEQDQDFYKDPSYKNLAMSDTVLDQIKSVKEQQKISLVDYWQYKQAQTDKILYFKSSQQSQRQEKKSQEKQEADAVKQIEKLLDEFFDALKL